MHFEYHCDVADPKPPGKYMYIYIFSYILDVLKMGENKAING